MRKGFTLVELSIVLVIIGLLIGGILVAQSMISSAQVLQQVRQIQQYDIVVKNFMDTYKQLPGDSILFTPNGNNNGCFNYTSSTCMGGLNLSEESRAFWRHLSDADLLSEKYTEDHTNGGQPGKTNPKGVFKNFSVVVSSIAGSSAIYSVLSPSVALVPLYLYSPAKFSSTGGITLNTTTPGAPIALVAAVDIKIDDGIPLRGRFNAFTGGDSTKLCFNTADVNGPYLFSNPNAICSFILPLTSEYPL